MKLFSFITGNYSAESIKEGDLLQGASSFHSYIAVVQPIHGEIPCSGLAFMKQLKK
jgi:hypothetical protein